MCRECSHSLESQEVRQRRAHRCQVDVPDDVHEREAGVRQRLEHSAQRRQRQPSRQQLSRRRHQRRILRAPPLPPPQPCNGARHGGQDEHRVLDDYLKQTASSGKTSAALVRECARRRRICPTAPGSPDAARPQAESSGLSAVCSGRAGRRLRVVDRVRAEFSEAQRTISPAGRVFKDVERADGVLAQPPTFSGRGKGRGGARRPRQRRREGFGSGCRRMRAG